MDHTDCKYTEASVFITYHGRSLRLHNYSQIDLNAVVLKFREKHRVCYREIYYKLKSID